MNAMTEQSCIHCTAENNFMFPFLSVLLEDTMLEKVGMSIF